MIQKILVVEDDIVFCKILTRYLEKNNFQTMDAQTGKGAYVLIEENNYDLAILDYRLPDENGINILKHIKKTNPDTRVILVTKFGDKEIETQAKMEGVDAFVSKPINPVNLLEVIQGL